MLNSHNADLLSINSLIYSTFCGVMTLTGNWKRCYIEKTRLQNSTRVYGQKALFNNNDRAEEQQSRFICFNFDFTSVMPLIKTL